MRVRPGDERGIIMSWLVRLVLGFLLVAVVIYDGGSILVNFFTLDSTADEIAVQITTDATGSPSLSEIDSEARELAKGAGARLIATRVEGDVVFITLRRRADTLVVGRISWIADWARATVEGQAGST